MKILIYSSCNHIKVRNIIMGIGDYDKISRSLQVIPINEVNKEEI